MFSHLKRLFRRRGEDKENKPPNNRLVEIKSKASTSKALSGQSTINVITAPDFKLIKRINHGAFGVVYHCEGRARFEGKQLAVKVYDFKSFVPLEEQIDNWDGDVRAVALELYHPHIVPLLGHCTLRQGKSTWMGRDVTTRKGTLGCIVMSYLDGPDLDNVLRKRGFPAHGFTWFEIRAIITQIGEAIHYLQASHNLLHHDLKLSNIILTRTDPQWHLVLVDFGRSEIDFVEERFTYQAIQFAELLLSIADPDDPVDQTLRPLLVDLTENNLTLDTLLHMLAK